MLSASERLLQAQNQGESSGLGIYKTDLLLVKSAWLSGVLLWPDQMASVRKSSACD
jgi:hypothetical protein